MEEQLIEVIRSAMVFDWLTEKVCESSLNKLHANYTFLNTSNQLIPVPVSYQT